MSVDYGKSSWAQGDHGMATTVNMANMVTTAATAAKAHMACRASRASMAERAPAVIDTFARTFLIGKSQFYLEVTIVFTILQRGV